MSKFDPRPDLPGALHAKGGLTPDAVRDVSRETGVPEAELYGVGSFYHLLNEPDVQLRVCVGLSCRLGGADAVLAEAKACGVQARPASCLAACDKPVPVLRGRDLLADLQAGDVQKTGGDLQKLGKGGAIRGVIGPLNVPDEQLVMRLHRAQQPIADAQQRAHALGREALFDALQTSGLQGRGGAGFPAHFKWRAVAKADDPVRYVVLNADEGEPGTFKDREVLIRRPDLVVSGLTTAAWAVGAKDVYCYLRGAFDAPWTALTDAIEAAKTSGALGDIRFHMHAGHGAYICGEETALLNALEGKQGKPRNKPPYPTTHGLWNKPTLVHNVETIACVPAIVENGGEWFAGLGKTGPGTKLYSISGHVQRPGVYELPLGVSLDELVAEAGGYIGELKAFCPGGASAGFLPASERTRALDFKALRELDTFLGSAGVVVLNDTVDMAWAARELLAFFEDESCGQCAPCRIGTRMLREHADAFIARTGDLSLVGDIAWEMVEGSICGLGHAAHAPLTSAMRYFPAEFR